MKETQDADRRTAKEEREKGNEEIYEELRKMREKIEESQAIDRKQINDGF